MDLYRKFVNPYLGKLLSALKMDKEFLRGEGCYLYDAMGERYLDCIAAYGALPFGYNPVEIWQVIQGVEEQQEPSFIQPSSLKGAGELAKRLVELAPGDLQYVTFTNSGAEAVEAAIKLCRSATGRQGILTTTNSFHGKTLGALSATGNPYYQKVFGAPIPDFSSIPYGDLGALESELQSHPHTYAAFILEPIQGEGGIVEPPIGYLEQAHALCREYGVTFVLDEIQTGLGRTGHLFACQAQGVQPDVLLLAKALGGGIIPIGACLATSQVYNEEFATKHSSTFAGNTLACRVGLHVLDLLAADDGKILVQVREKGHFIKAGLERLQEKFPHLIQSVRGQGFMLGLEFTNQREAFPGSILGIMAHQELLTPVIASYLLNREKIRVAPTLNGNRVIRIEPPLIFTMTQCQELLTGLERMLEVLARANTAKFLAYLIDMDLSDDILHRKKTQEQSASKRFTQFNERPASQIRTAQQKASCVDKEVAINRFAFLMHPLDIENYSDFDESLGLFNESQLQDLVTSWNQMVDPFVLSEIEIMSHTGARAQGEFIVIPRTAAELAQLSKKEALSQLRTGLDLARKGGAKIVGLGAYTSVISGGGLYLKEDGLPLTTGNSYSVVSAVDASHQALERLGLSFAEVVGAVIGATGSIGKHTALLLAPQVKELLLIGNPQNHLSSMRRLTATAAAIYQYIAGELAKGVEYPAGSIASQLMERPDFPTSGAESEPFLRFAQKTIKEGPIIATTASDRDLPRANLVICSTSSLDKLITPDNLQWGAVVCDMSRPGNVSREVDRLRTDVLVIDGGVIEVPGRPSLGWNFGFDEGLAYACMAETMMLALEGHFRHTSIGSSGINLDSLLFTRNLAKRHGFQLAQLRSFNRPLDHERWQQLLLARKQAVEVS